MAGERPEQAHHALDDLDRGLHYFLFCHSRELLEIFQPILQYEIGSNNQKHRFWAVVQGLTTDITSNALFLLYYGAPPLETHRIHTAMSKTATLTRNRNGNGRNGNGHGRNGNGRGATAA
ncbi:MAG: hypothetical protein ACREIS_14090, partial [Nitrospiraceae bacterium]